MNNCLLDIEVGAIIKVILVLSDSHHQLQGHRQLGTFSGLLRCSSGTFASFQSGQTFSDGPAQYFRTVLSAE